MFMVLFVVAIVIGIAFAIGLYINEKKKYRYLVFIHVQDGDRIVPYDIEKAKLVRIEDLRSGYRVYFKTTKKREIAITDSHKAYFIGREARTKIIPVFTPDFKQYFPTELVTIEKAKKLNAGYVPDFNKNASVIESAIATIRHARMLSSKAWAKFIEIAVPVVMVIVLVAGAIFMFSYAADFSANIKEAAVIQANMTQQLAKAIHVVAGVTEKALNTTTGRVPIPGGG